MLPSDFRVVCPKDPNHDLFSVSAHVSEEWEVTPQGDFVRVIQGLDTIHAPDTHDQYLCRYCNTEAKVVRVKDAERAELFSVTFNFHNHQSVTIPCGRGFYAVPGTIRWVTFVNNRLCFEWESEVKKDGP